MMSYMTMIYIDDDDGARQTGIGASMETNAETWAAFNRYRAAEVPKGHARFLLDYYNVKGDLADTIRLDATAFEAVTGEKVKTDTEYRQIDEKYWQGAREAYDAKRAAW